MPLVQPRRARLRASTRVKSQRLHYAPTRSRRLNELCGLLVLAAAALLPAGASASSARCDPGEFCLYYWYHRSGGLYDFSGSDLNLFNDHFEVSHTNRIVANLTLSVWNRGLPGARDAVLVRPSLGTNGMSLPECL